MSTSSDLMLDFDSTVFSLLAAMAMFPGGERITYEATKTWDMLVDLCGPEGADLSHEDRIPIMLGLFDKAMAFDHMVSMGDQAVFAGCVEQLQAIAASGTRIHVVTDRPPNRIEGTADFLRHVGIPFEGIHRVSGRDKTQWCIDNSVHVMVDDHPDTITQAAAAGLSVHGLAYHFNLKQAAAAGVKLSESWDELGLQITHALSHTDLQAA